MSSYFNCQCYFKLLLRLLDVKKPIHLWWLCPLSLHQSSAVDLLWGAYWDTIVNYKIREDETRFLANPKGVFLLQLFGDLHPGFTNRYLHQAGSDEVLICEVHCVAHETANVLLDENLSRPIADTICDRLREDLLSNIFIDFEIKGTKHTVTYDAKVTRSHILTCVKDKLTECKKHLAVHGIQHHRSNQGRKSFWTNECI